MLAPVHLEFLLEDITSKMQSVLEAVGDMQKHTDLIPQMREDITYIKKRLETMKQPSKIQTAT